MARKTGKTKKTKLWRRAGIALVGLLLGLNLYRWNAASLGGNALPMPFGVGAAVVLSGSMSPALQVNDLVVVKETDRYKTGDIVVYQSGAELIVHRIVAQQEGRLVTRGDANNAADEPIETRAVKGRVVARIPFVGVAVNALKSPAGILAVLVTAFILTEFSFRREMDGDEKELEAIKEEIRRLKEQ